MSRKKLIFLFIFIFTLLLNLLSWISTPFADFYALHVFPLWVTTYGRLTSLAPFSVGEILIVTGLLWLFALFTLHLILLICASVLRKGKTQSNAVHSPESSDRICYTDSRIGEFCNIFRSATVKLLIIIFLIMTLNCFINYHCTPIGADNDREFTISELSELRDYIVEKCNELAEEVPRDENGHVIFAESGQVTSSGNAAMALEARRSVAALGPEFPRLDGFYVTPKALFFSGFMSQQYMCGYYFPFSMEANYNDVMYIMNKPFTMCHELCHTRSYIFEDEANYLAYRACVGSENVVFNYGGYLGVLNYVNNAFYENVSKAEYRSHVKISDKVRGDNIFLTEDSWKKVEDNAVLPTETVKQAADTFVDTTLKVNGVSDGKASYDRVVELLLEDYYDSVR